MAVKVPSAAAEVWPIGVDPINSLTGMLGTQPRPTALARPPGGAETRSSVRTAFGGAVPVGALDVVVADVEGVVLLDACALDVGALGPGVPGGLKVLLVRGDVLGTVCTGDDVTDGVAATVMFASPLAKAVLPVEPVAKAIATVWTAFGAEGNAPLDGSFNTLMVKSITQILLVEPGWASVIGPEDAVKLTWPVT